MKKIFLYTMLLAASGAAAQSSIDQTLETEGRRSSGGTIVKAPLQPSETEIIGHKYTLDGIAVQLVKAGNPLQLLNPYAPVEKYGDGRENAVRDPQTGKVHGLKLFSIKF